MLFNYYMLPQVFCISYFCEVTSIEIVYVVRNKKKKQQQLMENRKKKKKKREEKMQSRAFF